MIHHHAALLLLAICDEALCVDHVTIATPYHPKYNVCNTISIDYFIDTHYSIFYMDVHEECLYPSCPNFKGTAKVYNTHVLS